MVNGPRLAILSGIAVVLSITLVVLLAVSVKVVKPTELCLDYNKNTFKVNTDKLYEQGRHFLGVGHACIRFPTYIQAIRYEGSTQSDDEDVYRDVTISARSKDGLVVMLDVGVQYKLSRKPEDLLAIYHNYEGKWAPILVKILRQAIRDVVSDFTAKQFRMRLELAAALEAGLQIALVENGFELVQSHLLSYWLPAQFLNAIEETIVVQQQEQWALATRAALQVTLATNFDQAQIAATATTMKLLNKGNVYQILKNADATVVETKLAEDAKALKFTKDAIFSGEASNAKLLDYVWLQEIQESTSPNMLVDVAMPSTLR